ncbi:MAG TPA: L,D-transpeptidase family protein [Elusimicrobiales bacterium]|nr:L,D-transpeptidase family protein [Elusimicrobiales bacterium]
MIRTILSLVLFVSSAGLASALDPADLQKELAGLGSPDAVAAPAENFPVPVPNKSPGTDELTRRLRAEAAADPAKFIDEHTPYEVGLAFDLPVSRYVLTDQDRIQNAAVRITVDLSRQRLVLVSSDTAKEFKISSGLAPEHGTPGSGKCYAPDFIEAMHYSSLYNKAPMPNSVFFNGNIAIHGTNAEAMLGRPASHGCIRLSKADSKTVYDLVLAKGKRNTSICVKGVTPKPV